MTQDFNYIIAIQIGITVQHFKRPFGSAHIVKKMYFVYKVMKQIVVCSVGLVCDWKKQDY